MSWYPQYEQMRVPVVLGSSTESDWDPYESLISFLLWDKAQTTYLCERMKRFNPPMLNRYTFNPSRSQSSPWARSDMWRDWHPFDALLAERRAALKGERDAAAAAAHKDAAWWDERRRG